MLYRKAEREVQQLDATIHMVDRRHRNVAEMLTRIGDKISSVDDYLNRTGKEFGLQLKTITNDMDDMRDDITSLKRTCRRTLVSTKN